MKNAKTNKKQILQMTLLSCLSLVLFSCATPLKKVQISNEFAANGRLPSLKVAILPLNGEQDGAKFFREALHVALMDTGLNISERFVVDGVIKKNGWNTPEKLFAIPPQKLGEAFGADALLYGKVTRWNKYYAIIHSTLVVGLEIKLVDARTGELLWSGKQVAREFEGLIKIPTGIISAIVSPLIFIGEKSNLHSLASQVARNITETLRKPHTIKDVDKMDQKIIIASADEYIKKIEKNNVFTVINPGGGVLVDDSFPSIKVENLPSLEDGDPSLKGIRSNSIKTAEAEEKDLHIPKPGKKTELQKTNNIAPIMPERSSVTSQAERTTTKTGKSADRKTKISKSAKISPGKKNIYTIQVGAFLSRSYAKSLIEKLKRKGYNSFIAIAGIGKEIWHKVQIDRFQDKKKAILYAKKLRKKEKLSYFITKTDVAPPA